LTANHVTGSLADAEPAAPLWIPDASVIERANLTDYLRWLQENRNLAFGDYQALWRWSVEDLEGFWSSIWDYYGLSAHSAYDQVLAERSMPGARWFTGAKVNFTEACLWQATDARPAIVSVTEGQPPVELSWSHLSDQVASVAATLTELGVRRGDRVAGYLPNIPQAVVALLATASIGAVWTACSQDFGTPSVLSRLQQVEPKVLVVADGYPYAGKHFDRRGAVDELVEALGSVEHVIAVAHLYEQPEQPWFTRADVTQLSWDDCLARHALLEFAELDFDHPLWLLWSSGTTGIPKGIVQGHGGILVELYKALGLGVDLHRADRFFFLTSTSWMVWNFMVAALLHGSTIVLYDGSPTYPDVNGVWRVAQDVGATVVGVGAGYLSACEKADATPAAELDLSRLRSVLQTGSPLSPQGWAWVYEQVKSDLWLQSVCGGTDLCSALVGGSPLLPVYSGKIQCAALGVAIEAWDSHGTALVGEQGELVVTEPTPSMPLYFWNDPDGSRYRDSYFDTFPGVWRHGDWVTIATDGTVVVSGRSDSTLNRMGVRMGSADIYAIVDRFTEVADSLVVGVERPGGDYFMPLFLVPAPGQAIDDELKSRIVKEIRTHLSPRHVPDVIVAAPAVPRTLTGKKLEVPVKRILQGVPAEQAGSSGAIDRPDMLAWFASYAEREVRRSS
jgi:acetoacetyl-CoA synthetase